MQPNALQSQKYDIGKAVFFYAPPWDGTTNLFSQTGPLIHLGTTEGEFMLEPNAEYSELTLPESLGPAALKRFLTGTRPTAEIGLFPDLTQLQIVSPTGYASMGQERQVPVRQWTVWVAPEQLFLRRNPVTGFMETVPVYLESGVWKKDGVAITDPEDQRLLDMSSVIWLADFDQLTIKYSHPDGGKGLVPVALTAGHDLTKPEGCQQVLVLGEAFGQYAPFAALLDFEPV